MTRDHITELRSIAKVPSRPSHLEGIELERTLLVELVALGLVHWDAGGGIGDDGQPVRLRVPAHRITIAGEAVLLAFEIGRVDGAS